MKFHIWIIVSLFLSITICNDGFTAGGKGNQAQLGKKLYVWDFDEGSGNKVKDATAGLEGEINGDIKWTDGILGKAVKMSGVVGKPQFIEIPNSNEIDIDAAITMMAWIFPDELPVGGQENKGTIFYKNSYYLQIEPGAGQLAYYFYDTTSPGYHISDGKIKAKEWSHVAIVWDGSEARFYFNGEHDGKVIPQKGPGRSAPDRALKFGGEANGCCPRFFQGSMDELMLANYALSEADIQKIINETLDISARGKMTTTWANIKR